jgi:RsiW-degrading membrane proteinase PrsW (M82 family)
MPAPHGASLPDVQAKVSQAFDQLVRDIRSFNFKWVVPLDTALSPEFIRNRSVWVMLLFAFFPLVALSFHIVDTAPGLVLLLMIYFAFAWACFYYYFIARRSTDLLTGFGVMAFTALVGIKLVDFVQTLPGLHWLYAGIQLGDPNADATRQLMGFLFGVGPVEEGFKALPVLVAAFWLKKVEKPIDGIFLGAMSGLGFAISEGAGYVLMQGQDPIVQILIRSTSLPFIHSLWSAILGYFIALAVINRSRGPALVVAGYCICIVLHGCYDWSGGMVSVLLAAFTYLLFVSYMERSQAMVAELQIAEKQAEEQAKMQSLWQQQYGHYAMPAVLAGPYAPPQSWPPGGPPAR